MFWSLAQIFLLVYFVFHLLITITPLLHAHLLPCNSPDQEAHFHIFGIQAEDFSCNRHLVGHTVRDFYLNVSHSTRIDLHDK